MAGLLKRLEQPPTLGASAHPATAGLDTFTERMMVDGGSNCTFTMRRRIFDLGNATPSRGSIGGIGSGLAYSHLVTVSASFGEGVKAPNVNLSLLYTPSGGKNIISESILLDEYGIEVNKKKMQVIHPCGMRTPLLRERGLFFADLTFSEPSGSSQPPAIANASELVASAASASDEALLWAARMGLGADGLERFLKAVKGVGLERVPKAQRDVIDSRMDRAIAQAKHAPVGTTPISELATKPGQVLICDGFGKHHAASPVDGAVYQFHAVCERSSFGFCAAGKTHTVDDWMIFLRDVALQIKKHGLVLERVRFDRAPELRTDELKQRAAKELGILVELTAREHHEGVGRAERNNDLLTRMAEEMLQRAQLGTAWLLPARAYAQWLLNRTPIALTGETRFQRFRSEVPNFGVGLTPYLFGTTVSIVEDVKGPKGSLDHPRGSIGRIVGVTDSGYIVWRDARRNVVYQSSVKPLNERAMIVSQLPPAVAGVEIEIQTEGDARVDVERAPDDPPFKPGEAEQRRTRRAQRPAVPVVDVDDGAHIEVLWQEHDGSWVWYEATVLGHYTQKDGKRRHNVHYEGFGEWAHNLADQGEKEWRYLEQRSAAQPAGDANERMTRSRSGARDLVALQAACEMVDAVLEATPCTFGVEGERRQAAAFNAAVYQALGDAGESYECANASDIDRARLKLQLGAVATNEPTVRLFDISRAYAFKASQNVIDVNTELGPRQFVVPATFKQAAQSEQASEWEEADRKALDAILLYPGNRIVPISVPIDQGLPIARCVTQRRIKVDAATGGLESRRPWDAANLRRLSAASAGVGLAAALAPVVSRPTCDQCAPHA